MQENKLSRQLVFLLDAEIDPAFDHFVKLIEDIAFYTLSRFIINIGILLDNVL